MIGAKQKLKVRLIALPLRQAQSNERRKKAKTDRDRRLNHDEAYFELLGYTIYITNISKEQGSAENIYNLYKLRWNIEIIFKSWKSCFCIEKLIHAQCVNAVRVNCIIYLILLYIFLFHVIWWHHCQSKLADTNSERLSVLKMTNFFRLHFITLISLKFDTQIIKQIRLHCQYDERKDMDNASQFLLKMTA